MDVTHQPNMREPVPGNGGSLATAVVDPDQFSRRLLTAMLAFRDGEFGVRLPSDLIGVDGKIADAFNDIVAVSERRARETARVSRSVGKEGKLKQRMSVPGAAGGWADEVAAINLLIDDLVWPTTEVTRAVGAVAKGDLGQSMALEVDGRPLDGEFLRSARLVNKMIDQLSVFTSEVTRVAREVGTEGKLGGQAEVPDVAGTWKDLTDSVNVMAANLTDQVRGIVKVVTAVADGNLRQKLTVEAKGEVAALAETINNMTNTLATFAEQVTNVAREVGVEGRLGGQANVPGAAGTWKDLTGNVNLLAANLTNQVRAIAEVATAVTKGDLTRSIQVEARGEVAELKDNINTMIGNLRGTTDRNQEQDWLKTNLARFTRMLQGQRDLVTVGKLLLSELAPLVNAQQGSVYQMLSEAADTSPSLSLLAGYAIGDDQATRIAVGRGLVGQCAIEKQRILITKVPRNYAKVHSSLGGARPRNVVVLPVLFEGETKAVIELSSLQLFTPTHLTFLEQLTQSIGVVLNTIEATMRTENLLQQSQQLTMELQQTNEELASKAKQLAEQNVEVERKNKEVEHARRALEEKAAELALTSKYKSEFLANMSHELRTPLNSILILGQQLAENTVGNLMPKQVDFARNIHSAGTDLLTLINDILDLSKIESGTVTVEAEEITFNALRDSVERNFHHLAEAKNLTFHVEIDNTLPRAFTSDPKRLQQILKNLLSNAFKFTAHGVVAMRVQSVGSGWSPDHPVLRFVPGALAIEVSDTGIGIAPEKQRLIFEAFQQADAGTSRKYGGTGLGLAISRELASLLGGEIRLVSTPGQGSTFTLYLPLQYTGPARAVTAPALASAQAGMRSGAATLPVLAVAKAEEIVADDRETIREGENILLIVVDDAHYARVLLGLARDKGFKGIVANRGQSAITLAKQYLPTAITLDVFLPDMLGWTVLNNLKLDPATRHIPVQMLSVEEERQHGLSHGAFSYLVKPAIEDLEHAFDRLKSFVAPHKKRLLVIEDNAVERQSIVELLAHDDIEVATADSGRQALEILGHHAVDCCVVDLRLPDNAVILRSKIGVFVDVFRKTRALADLNAALHREVAEREKAQQALQLANQELERRVHERTAALRDARDEAERQSRIKDEFLATLSHELRTPMNVILGWLDTLTKGKAIRDPRSALTVVQRNAEIQAKLIDDLLDMNRLLAGNLHIELMSVDVGGTIRSAIQGLQPAADAKGVELDCVIDVRDVGVLADARRLQQVMWNLLHNAIKFTPRGGRVEVRVGQQNGHVTIVVQDNGHGIHREFLPHVFERFRQQDASTTRESPGLGLGLSIAKHLVELHGGRIGAFSDGEGAGATFVVELPAVK